MVHVVNKITFEATCFTETTAFEVRWHLSDFCEYQLVHTINKVCSKYTPDHEVIRIDTLEIDMHEITSTIQGYSFSQAFETAFEQSIKKQLMKMPVETSITSLVHSHVDLIFYFFETGRLPWWAGSDPIQLDEILAEVWLHAEQDLKKYLHQQRTNHSVWKRLSLQLNYPDLEKVIVMFEELGNACLQLKILLDECKQLEGPDHPGSGHEAAKRMRAERFIIEHAPDFFQNQPGKYKASLFRLLAEQQYPGFTAGDQVEGMDAAYANITSTEELSNIFIDKEHMFDAGLPNEKYSIRYAGLVLLSGFFQPFFSGVGLLENGKWKDESAAVKAVHLLHFICTGALSSPEYSLLFEKIICGIPVSQPIPRHVELHSYELQEVDDMLKSVIGHWSILKNTSVNGLRESFLKRDGVLYRQGNNWQLQVEKKTQDVLLESIPWGYTTIHSTWCNELIYVVW